MTATPNDANFLNSYDIFKGQLNLTDNDQTQRHIGSTFGQAAEGDKVICRTSCFPQESMHDFRKGTGFKSSFYHNATAVGLKPCVLLRTMKASSADGADAQNDIIYSRTTGTSISVPDHHWFNSMVLPMSCGGFFLFDDLCAAAVASVTTGVAQKKTIQVKAGPFKNNTDHQRELQIVNNRVPKMTQHNISVISTKRKAGPNNIWNLFDINKNRKVNPGEEIPAVPPADNENIFLIIDCGDSLLKELKKRTTQLPVGRTFTMNIMHSALTYSDSATGKCLGSSNRVQWAGFRKPEAGRTYNAYDWEVNHLSMKKIYKNNPVFLSEYNVDITESTTGNCHHCTQWWKHPDGKPAGKFPTRGADPASAAGTLTTNATLSTLLKVYDPNQANTKTNVADEVKGASTLEEANFALQRKRSGDHFQIYAAYDFPNIAAKHAWRVRQSAAGGVAPPSPFASKNPGGTWKGTTYPPIDPATHDFPTPPNTLSYQEVLAWYKERTFFLTHDTPAATYSIMCGVNTILNNSGSNDFIASFNLAHI